MKDKVLVIAPHPDDESLGCGGTLLRRKSEGAELAWLIVTGMSEKDGWSKERISDRSIEIKTVAKSIGFSKQYDLGLPTTRLDRVPKNEIINKFSEVFREYEPTEILTPHYSDVHTDHRAVFEATEACSKWFRYPSIKRVLAYETLSETDYGLGSFEGFKPNYFVDISEFIKNKLEVVNIYKSEIGNFPFPRSIEALEALAKLRGSMSGYVAAEAFQLLRERH